MDKEKVIKGLEQCTAPTQYGKGGNSCTGCLYLVPRGGFNQFRCDGQQLMKDALALLKEQEAVVKQWTKEIADNQLAHAPKDSHEFMSLDEHLENEYKRGIWDGLQIAWNIISEGR